MADHGERLRHHTDEEMLALAAEVVERGDTLSVQLRQQINDELRRRKLPLLEQTLPRRPR